MTDPPTNRLAAREGEWRRRLNAIAELQWASARSAVLAEEIERTARILAHLDGVRLPPDVEPDFIRPLRADRHE